MITNVTDWYVKPKDILITSDLGYMSEVERIDFEARTNSYELFCGILNFSSGAYDFLLPNSYFHDRFIHIRREILKLDDLVWDDSEKYFCEVISKVGVRIELETNILGAVRTQNKWINDNQEYFYKVLNRKVVNNKLEIFLGSYKEEIKKLEKQLICPKCGSTNVKFGPGLCNMCTNSKCNHRWW